MKLLKSTLLMALATIMAVSCENGLPTDNYDQSANKGYLSLSALSVELVTDHKPVDGDVAKTRSAATRAVDINDFDCFIYDESGNNVIRTFKYGERPTQSIELDGGKYIFKMISGEIAGAAFESPVYGLSEPFTIVRKQTTTLTDLVCTLQNIQASVSYSADLRAALSDDTTATLTVGSSSLVYAIDDSRSGYFKAEKALNDIDVLVKGLYTQEGKEPATFDFTTVIKDVKAGQHSDIQLYIEYSAEGNISIQVTIDGWVVDQSVVFDLASLISEDVMVDDDDKPTVVLVGGDIDAPVELYASDFDASGNCTKNIVVDIATKSPIASALVEISSTNAAMVASLADYNLTSSFDLCNAGTASASLRLMGLPVNNQVLGQTSVSYDLTAQMKLLKEYAGTHSFKLTVADEQGGVTTKTLVINMAGEQTAPSVVWVGGYDFNTRYPITDELTVDLAISVPAGIEEFVVTINSEVLTPSQLAGVGLCDNLDLCDSSKSYDSSLEDPSQTDTSQVLTALKNFGFMPDSGSVDADGNPIYLDSWKGQTTANLSITKFLGLLKITGAGTHDFIFNITDTEGNKLTRTLMLVTLE